MIKLKSLLMETEEKDTAELMNDVSSLESTPNILEEHHQIFDLMGYRFDIDSAELVIRQKGIKPIETKIVNYAEKFLGLKRNEPEHKPESFFAHIDYDYLDQMPEDKLDEAGIIATIRTPDDKVYKIVIDGNHRLAKNYMSGKDTMKMYILGEKDTKNILIGYHR